MAGLSQHAVHTQDKLNWHFAQHKSQGFLAKKNNKKDCKK
jgi:hypothetical protein